jgi:hypothetical protein
VLPLLSAPILYCGIIQIRGGTELSGARPARSLLGAALVTAAAVLCLGGIWEVVEWVADAAFGTDFSQGNDDTFDDLRNDGIAAACGGALVAGWTRPDRRA